MIKKVLLVLVLFNVLELCLGQAECPIVPPVPEDRRADKSKLSIATLNLEWLFFDEYAGSSCPGTGCPWDTVQDAEEHIKVMAEVLKQADIDIVNLVEVEDCTTLHLLLAYMGDDSYRGYLKKGTDTATGQNVALITRVDPIEDIQRTDARAAYPIPGTKCGSSPTGTTGVSKHQYTTFNIDGLDRPLSFIGVHFVAFPDRTDRCLQREGQATVIHQLATQLTASGNYLAILGDMNDFDATVSDPANNVPISQVLKILRNTTMYNIAASIPDQADRYSCWYDKDSNCETAPLNEQTLIDHVLISNSLQSKIHSVQIMNHLYPPSCFEYYSDHWPVVVTLDTSA